ncbi:histidine phosphatase family protein [Saccharopolyspora halophila]|uniref:Histidine phosphatase family protein n=1 Tax=Saccharopolyspora halophila TaxID=405551 RepID=A0ABN3GQ06_9PSEU
MSLEQLVLWRHGETDYNLAGRIQGHLDSSLTDNGLRQARLAAPSIDAFEPSVAVSSDLNRARTTAQVYAEVSGAGVALDKRLRETHVGEWQGLSGAEVEHGWPGALSTWRADPTWAPPGGESRVEVASRAVEVVTELDHGHRGTALLVAHGGLITALTAKLLALPVESWPILGGIRNCHWVVLKRRGGGDHRWRLMAHNAGVGE